IFKIKLFGYTNLFCFVQLTTADQFSFSEKFLPVPFIIFMITRQDLVCSLAIKQNFYIVLFCQLKYLALGQGSCASKWFILLPNDLSKKPGYFVITHNSFKRFQ